MVWSLASHQQSHHCSITPSAKPWLIWGIPRLISGLNRTRPVDHQTFAPTDYSVCAQTSLWEFHTFFWEVVQVFLVPVLEISFYFEFDKPPGAVISKLVNSWERACGFIFMSAKLLQPILCFAFAAIPVYNVKKLRCAASVKGVKFGEDILAYA